MMRYCLLRDGAPVTGEHPDISRMWREAAARGLVKINGAGGIVRLFPGLSVRYICRRGAGLEPNRRRA